MVKDYVSILTGTRPDENDIYYKVREIVIDVLGVDAEEVQPGAYLADDLGADEFDTEDICNAIGMYYGIQVPLARFGAARTVSQAVKVVKKCIDADEGYSKLKEWGS